MTPFFALEWSELIKVNRLVCGGINLEAFNSCHVTISEEVAFAHDGTIALSVVQSSPSALFNPSSQKSSWSMARALPK